jgi:hypothetical protein
LGNMTQIKPFKWYINWQTFCQNGKHSCHSYLLWATQHK